MILSTLKSNITVQQYCRFCVYIYIMAGLVLSPRMIRLFVRISFGAYPILEVVDLVHFCIQRVILVCHANSRKYSMQSLKCCVLYLQQLIISIGPASANLHPAPKGKMLQEMSHEKNRVKNWSYNILIASCTQLDL